MAEGATHVGICDNIGKSAFTLAEVLITLAIIGVVAAMTIPTLISNYQEKVTVTKVKKFYAILSQAHKLATIENGPQSSWGMVQSEYNGLNGPAVEDFVESNNSMNSRDLYIDKLAPYLKIVSRKNYKDCYGSSDVKWMKLNGAINSDTYCPLAVLADGTTIVNAYYSTVHGNYGDMKVDFNGEAGPNTYGKDIFVFYFSDDGVAITSINLYDSPIKDFKEYVDTTCLAEDANGYGCTAWILDNSNMDYLECDGLEYGVKNKCSDL